MEKKFHYGIIADSVGGGRPARQIEDPETQDPRIVDIYGYDDSTQQADRAVVYAIDTLYSQMCDIYNILP